MIIFSLANLNNLPRNNNRNWKFFVKLINKAQMSYVRFIERLCVEEDILK